MMSFLRSVMTRKPSASSTPMSPVWNQPVGVDGLGGGLGLVVVALHDVRAAGQDLAVLRDLDLDALEGRAHRARLQRVGPVDA